MSDYIVDAIKSGIWETLSMTFFSSLFSYIIGLPLGVILYSTSKGRLLQNRPVNFVLGFIVNIMRSLPFLILLVLLIPFTRFVVGTSIGTTASIVPLTVGAIPIVARMVESSLEEVQPGIHLFLEMGDVLGQGANQGSQIGIVHHMLIPRSIHRADSRRWWN